MNTLKIKQNKKRKVIAKALIVLASLVLAVLIWKNIAADYQKTLPIPGFEHFLSKKDICTIAIFNDEIWAGGINGLFVLRKNDADNTYEEIEKGKFREVKALLADTDGCWVGHRDGLSFIKDNNITTFAVPEGLPDKRVNALEFGNDGVLWVGTWGGIALLEDGKIKSTLTVADGLIENMVNVIFKDSQNNMWIGSYVAPRGGVTIINDKKIQSFSTERGLLHANINAIIEIKDNIILTGGGLFTKGGGTVFHQILNKWDIARTITVDDGLAGEKIRALFLDSTNRLWIGSEYDGLAIFENFNFDVTDNLEHTRITILTRDSGLPNDEVKVIKETIDGDIWIGTRSGLLKIEKGGMENGHNPD